MANDPRFALLRPAAGGAAILVTFALQDQTQAEAGKRLLEELGN